MLFVQFHRELNISGIFNFVQYFADLGGTKTWTHWEGKIAPWYMAWFHIKYIERESKVSSSNNCNKIFGLRKISNFRAPNKSDPTVILRSSLSRI